MVTVKGGSGRFQTRFTPPEDNVQARRAPVAVREGGPPSPIYGQGSVQSARHTDSHPTFGSPGIRQPTKRVDLTNDVRRELDE